MAKYSFLLILYGTFSTLLFGLSLFTLASRAYDYFTLIHELTDSFHLTLLVNFVVFCFILWGLVSTKLLFGDLRIIETEHLVDQLPFYGLSLLFILFNDDNVLLSMFWGGTTILLKLYHIINQDRLEHLQLMTVNNLHNINSPSLIFRTFASSIFMFYLLVSIVIDVFMAKLLVFDVFQGVSSIGSLLYGIQFAVMATDSFAYLWKVGLNVYELMFYRCVPHPDASVRAPTPQSVPTEGAEHSGSGDEDLFDDDNDDDETEQVWENKPLYTQTLEILSSVIKSVFYLIFSYMLYVHSNLPPPISMIQGGIVSMLQVVQKTKRLAAFLSQAKSLDKQLEDATVEDLNAADYMCIICRDNMHSPEEYEARRHKPLIPRRRPKKLRCGHILHMGCLKDWLERSSVCPLCRKNVFAVEALTPPQPQGTAQVPQETNTPNHGMHPTRTFPSGMPIPTSEATNVSVHGTNGNQSTNNMFTGRVPSGWTAFPITRTGPDRFTIRVSPTQSGTLIIRENTGDAQLYTLGTN